MALARHLEHTERGDRQDLMLGPVVLHRIAQGVEDLLPVLRVLHVDCVDHDKAPEIAELDLTGGFSDRLEISLGDEIAVLGAILTTMAARVDVDRREGLGLVDDNLASARERDAALEELFDLALDVVTLEDGNRIGVKLDAGTGARRHFAHEILD